MNVPFRKLLSAKIHRATVTQANVHYEGSITIPPELLAAAGIHTYESVWVWNVTRGTRLETYAITGQPNSSDICANGAAAHLIRPGDKVIIASFAFVPETELDSHRPRLVFVDDANAISHLGPEVPGPAIRDEHQPATAPSVKVPARGKPMEKPIITADPSGESTGANR
ncbi:MAG: aspartate 1-decarboxylase [Planctomycetota bacterium]